MEAIRIEELMSPRTGRAYNGYAYKSGQLFVYKEKQYVCVNSCRRSCPIYMLGNKTWDDYIARDYILTGVDDLKTYVMHAYFSGRLDKPKKAESFFDNMEYIIVETDEENPQPIAYIKALSDSTDIVENTADGYRIRCKWRGKK